VRRHDELRAREGPYQVGQHGLLPPGVQMQINFVDNHNALGSQNVFFVGICWGKAMRQVRSQG